MHFLLLDYFHPRNDSFVYNATTFTLHANEGSPSNLLTEHVQTLYWACADIIMRGNPLTMTNSEQRLNQRLRPVTTSSSTCFRTQISFLLYHPPHFAHNSALLHWNFWPLNLSPPSPPPHNPRSALIKHVIRKNAGREFSISLKSPLDTNFHWPLTYLHLVNLHM